MSAEDIPDDAAKVRAEERAERELQLKIDTLELERAKFLYARVQSDHDRLSAVMVRGSAALLFAEGSALILCLSYYKNLLDAVKHQNIDDILGYLLASFILAATSFISSLSFNATSLQEIKMKPRHYMANYWLSGVFTFLSFTMFIIIMIVSLRALKTV